MKDKTNKFKKILVIASEIFAKKGYEATSVREIALKAGLNKATIYHYFSSKEEILFKIMDNAMEEALKNLEAILSEDSDALEKFENVLKFYSKYYVSKQAELSLLVNELNSLKHEYKTLLTEKEKKYVDLMKSVLYELKKKGVLKEELPITVIVFTFFSIIHYTVKWYKPSGKIKVDELSEYFVEIFTKGIFKKR
jgi:AcrR family transcriptional regulator